MAMMIRKNWRSKVTLVRRFLMSSRAIPPLKGAIAYMIAMALIFVKPFDNKFPLAFTSVIIVAITGFPGKSIGATAQSIVFTLFGVCMGAVGFVILSELWHSPVSQGIVFAVWVYAMALLKAQGDRHLAPLFSTIGFDVIQWNIYLLLNTTLNVQSLKDYLASYCVAAAIVMVVNVVVFPVSSEKELRRTLVTSLEHVATLAHLIAKTYSLDINDQEKFARDQLVQNIRADFGFLQQKLGEASIEINYSYFSMKDYQGFVSQIRMCQLSLISAHSSLIGVETQDTELFRTRFLPGLTETFFKLRRAVDLTIRDIGEQLDCQPMVISATQARYSKYIDQWDLERQSAMGNSEADFHDVDADEWMQEVSQRLASEVKDMDNSAISKDAARSTNGIPAVSDGSSEKVDSEDHGHLTSVNSTTMPAQTPFMAATAEATNSLSFNGKAEPPSRLSTRLPGSSGASQLRRLYDEFSDQQHAKFTATVMNGSLTGGDDVLRLHGPLPSLSTFYGPDIIDAVHPDESPPRQLRKRTGGRMIPTEMQEEEGKNDVSPHAAEEDMTIGEKRRTDKSVMASSHSLLRVYTFIYAKGEFVDALEKLYESTEKKKRSFHVHIFESISRPHAGTDADGEREMSLAEAVAMLENRPYEPIKRNIWQKIERLEHMLRSPLSVFAAKTSAAVSVFTLLILTKKTQAWFISYGLTGGLVTVFVSLAPTLGQSISSFVLQVAGSGIGYLYALVLLEIFKGVGGFTYNPYGMACLLAPYAFGMSVILYESPTFLIISLLGLNSSALLIASEYVSTEVQHRKFDGPPLLTGKSLSGLVVALALAAIFQLFVLRNPARRTLRMSMADVVQSTLSLSTLLQAYVRAAVPDDGNVTITTAVKRRVQRELEHRELKIQTKIIELTPLVAFSLAEPQYSRPFKQDTIKKMIRTFQVILDRFREARTALGEDALDDVMYRDFVQPLSTYRKINFRAIQNSLWLISTSIAVKAPLPHETLAQWNRVNSFQHDALVLSTRFARDPEGEKVIRAGKFMRYWAYLMCMGSLAENLVVLEDLAKELGGELESKLL